MLQSYNHKAEVSIHKPRLRLPDQIAEYSTILVYWSKT